MRKKKVTLSIFLFLLITLLLFLHFITYRNCQTFKIFKATLDFGTEHVQRCFSKHAIQKNVKHYVIKFPLLYKIAVKYKRNFIRKVLGDIGSFLISVILNINIKDTQCGYKLYKRQHAKFAFSKLKNCGWDHDIELILLLKSKNIAIKELPIKWMHKENSKVNIFLDPIKMFIGILIIRFRYL